MTTPSNPRPQLQSTALIVGLVGCGVAIAGFVSDAESFWRAYHTAAMFWWQLTMGFLFLSLMRCILASNWGNACWPYLRASLSTLPLTALSFVPFVPGLSSIFPWAGGHVESSDSYGGEIASHGGEIVGGEHVHINPFQEVYFNETFFWGRTIGYFAVWFLASWLIARTGTPTGETRLPRRRLSLMMVLFVLVTTFAAFDWGMSLEPEWYSTIYGAMVLMAGVVAAWTVLAISLSIFKTMPDVPGLEYEQNLHDLGNLMLGFLMIWAYFSLSQFLIIWAGNLPYEVTWYLRRIEGLWQTVLYVLVLAHFLVPFFALLPQENKRNSKRLRWIAGLLLLANVLQTLWIYAPAWVDNLGDVHWSILFSWLGLGGLWFFLYVRSLGKCLTNDRIMRSPTS